MYYSLSQIKQDTIVSYLKETKTPYLMLGLKLLKFNDLTSIYGYDFTNEVYKYLYSKIN